MAGANFQKFRRGAMDALVSEPTGNFSSQTTNKYVNGKAKWELPHVIIFCDICKKEIDDGNRRGGGFKQLSWKTIACQFNKETGLGYDGNKMKHKWAALKKDWRNWRILRRLAKGLGWSSDKGTVDASDEWWDISIKANPEIRKFRTKGIPLEVEERLDGLFLGSVAKGDHMWSPSAGHPPNNFFEVSLTDNPTAPNNNNSPTSVEELHIDSTNQSLNGNDNDGSDDTNIISEVGADLVRKRSSVSSSAQKQKQFKKSKGGASMLSSKIDDIKEGIENHKNAIMARVNKLPPTISDAVKVLMSMTDDIPPCSDLYRFATKLFLNKEKREMFMALKEYKIRLWCLNQESTEAEANEARSFTGLIEVNNTTFLLR